MTPRVARAADASQLSFPLQLVVMIVSIALSAAGAIWATQSGLRSDVRDIRTRMELQSQVDDAQVKLQEERATNLRESMNAMKRLQEYQQAQITELRQDLAILAGKSKGQ